METIDYLNSTFKTYEGLKELEIEELLDLSWVVHKALELKLRADNYDMSYKVTELSGL